jgi:S1-C subfamily serine protease
MTVIDWAIVALVLVLVPIGYRQGLLVAGLGLGGFAAGAYLGARLAPLLLDEGSSSPYAPGIALAGGVLLGAAVAVIAEGIGQALRARLPAGLSAVDSVGGSIAFGALALALAWVAGALALNAPALKGVRADVQGSVVLGAVNDVLPPSGPFLNVLNRIDPTPQLQGPNADVPAPGKGITGDPEVVAAGRSVVHVIGTACGLNLSGSGWVAEPEVVVTNAHVIAGQSDTSVITRDGAELDASPVLYEPENDIAILRVDGLAERPLPLAGDPSPGTSGAVLGFPGNGEFTSVPARLGTTGEVTSQDSYGRGPIQRRMTSFRADVIGGNSGGPFVNGDGDVSTTVFAATVDSDPPQGLGVPNDVVARAVEEAGRPVGTGPCG